MIDNEGGGSYLSRLRKEVETETASPKSTDSSEYRAWGKSHAESRMEWLDIRLVPSEPEIEEEGEAVAVHLLHSINYRHYSASKGWTDRVTLVFADRLVTLEGRNLHEFRREMIGGQVDYVQAFNPARWPLPSAEKAVITKITIDQPGEEDQPPSLRLVKNDQE